jgi:hypothetical protein
MSPRGFLIGTEIPAKADGVFAVSGLHQRRNAASPPPVALSQSPRPLNRGPSTHEGRSNGEALE